jgi:hypothetical protein
LRWTQEKPARRRRTMRRKMRKGGCTVLLSQNGMPFTYSWS